MSLLYLAALALACSPELTPELQAWKPLRVPEGWTGEYKMVQFMGPREDGRVLVEWGWKAERQVEEMVNPFADLDKKPCWFVSASLFDSDGFLLAASEAAEVNKRVQMLARMEARKLDRLDHGVLRVTAGLPHLCFAGDS